MKYSAAVIAELPALDGATEAPGSNANVLELTPQMTNLKFDLFAFDVYHLVLK